MLSLFYFKTTSEITEPQITEHEMLIRLTRFYVQLLVVNDEILYLLSQIRI